ncbi:MAG: hypothetical protein AAGJ40_11195 [Planctomycetota bacterium]
MISTNIIRRRQRLTWKVNIVERSEARKGRENQVGDIDDSVGTVDWEVYRAG